MKFEHVKVYNWMNAIRGMRNSFGSWDKRDSEETLDLTTGELNFKLGENDKKLAMKLSKAGSSHGKYLRQIFVSFDLTAPDYFWVEEATYKVGTAENSTSTMHTFGRSEAIPVEDYGFDDPNHPLIKIYMLIINKAKDDWHKTGMKVGTPEWRRLIQLNSKAFLYKRTFTGNYQVLKTMYHDRRLHRLEEWREFCRFIETLPYSELITLREPS